MKELIIRISDNKQDVDVLVNNIFSNEITEKSISYGALLFALQSFTEINGTNKIKCRFFEDSIIGYASSGNIQKYLINQPEHKRYITYSVFEANKAYYINFPNSIYEVIQVGDEISEIYAYMYLNYEGIKTVLYEYAMPNMLIDNKICIGQASVNVDNGIINTLEKIIYSPYSHSILSNVKGFKTSEQYFEYLVNNKIEEKYLIKSKYTLRDRVC